MKFCQTKDQINNKDFFSACFNVYNKMKDEDQSPSYRVLGVFFIFIYHLEGSANSLKMNAK